MIKSQENRIKTRTAEIVLEEDGIVRVNNFPNMEITKEDAVENITAIKRILKGKKRPIFVNISELLSIDKNARDIIAAEESVSAVALLVGSPLSKIIGNFFMGLNKTVVPNKLFTSESAALEWLQGFLK